MNPVSALQITTCQPAGLTYRKYLYLQEDDRKRRGERIKRETERGREKETERGREKERKRKKEGETQRNRDRRRDTDRQRQTTIRGKEGK